MTPRRRVPWGRALVAGVVRAVVLVVAYAVVVGLLVGRDDGLGAGLVFSSVVVLFALVVGAYDGWRGGPVAALVTWVVAAVLLGLGVPVWDALSGRMPARGLGGQLADDWPVFVALTAAPALVGLLLGALAGSGWRRLRRRRAGAGSAPAQQAPVQ